MKDKTKESQAQDVVEQITYGFDPASPDGDYSALTIRIGKRVYTYIGEEAEAINHLLASARLDSAIAELARLHMEAPFEEADVVTDAKRETRGQEPLQTLDRYIRSRRAQLQAERNKERQGDE